MPTRSISNQHGEGLAAATQNLQDQVALVASSLVSSLREVVREIPGGEQGPTSIARSVGVSRVTASKLVNALACEQMLDAIARVPGPESLRAIVRGASRCGVEAGTIEEASARIDEFAALIRDRFGTRDGMVAAIAPTLGEPRSRMEIASRYDVFKGMRQVVGVEAHAWVCSMCFTPGQGGQVRVAKVHGAIGIRRLRPDVDVYFSVGVPSSLRAGEEVREVASDVDLSDLLPNGPAQFTVCERSGQLVYRLASVVLGMRSSVDMLTCSLNQIQGASTASPGRTKTGLACFADVPVRSMLLECVVHKDLFGGAAPKLMVYRAGARGPANPNDASRDVDLVATCDEPQTQASGVSDGGSGGGGVGDVSPKHDEIMERLMRSEGLRASAYLVHRCLISYPVHGFQYVLAFDLPGAGTE